MTIENQHDVEGLRQVGAIVSSVLASMLDSVEPGMTTDIDEPFVSTISIAAYETGDGWARATERGNLSAQFEHTVIVTQGAPIILTKH